MFLGPLGRSSVRGVFFLRSAEQDQGGELSARSAPCAKKACLGGANWGAEGSFLT